MLVGLVFAKGWQRGLAWRRSANTESPVGYAACLSASVKASNDLVIGGPGRVVGILFSDDYLGMFRE